MAAIDRPNEAAPRPNLSARQVNVLLAAAAVSSACGLAIELLLGTLASYLVGNQALSYGIAVGGFLAAMGLGSYLSQFVARRDRGTNDNAAQLLRRLVQVELTIAPLSGLLPLGLFVLFALDRSLWPGLVSVTVILGTLAGLEVPLLTRIIERDRGLKDSLARILALDYIGALFGSIAFPVLLLPLFGMFPTAALLGSLPALMVFAIGRAFPSMRPWGWWGLAIAAALWAIAPMTIEIGNALERALDRPPVAAASEFQFARRMPEFERASGEAGEMGVGSTGGTERVEQSGGAIGLR
ncbi:MAG: spermidine synthase [Geitlerinemataceae cyanobacterium]